MLRVSPERETPWEEAGSYLRLIDSCMTQLKAQGPSRTCNESKEEEEKIYPTRVAASASASAAVNPVATNGTCKESRLHVEGERCVVSS